ncbi:MAG TPA: hypothetical protein VEA38_00800 [Terriglobales bacterium]|nr:hypothetical protein [Terriglobales bacterium]
MSDLKPGDTLYAVDRWQTPPQIRTAKVIRVTPQYVFVESSGWGFGRRLGKAEADTTPEAAWARAIKEAEFKLSLAEAEWQRAKDRLAKLRAAAPSEARPTC